MLLTRLPRRRRTTTRRLSAAIAEALEPRRLLSFTVTTTADSGAGSLRQAILDANATGTAGQVIDFDIPGSGFQTVQPLTPLPTITVGTTIDGTSQPGFGGSPIIGIDGSLAGASAAGLTASVGAVTIEDLIIVNFTGPGIDLTGPVGGSTLIGNYLGIDPTGTAGPNLDGVDLNDFGGDTIGGATAADANVISANFADGINLASSSAANNIQGNLIGTDPSGSLAKGNGESGILVASQNNLIGGATSSTRNLISANLTGVLLSGPAATNNIVASNFIGTDISAAFAVGNLGNGIEIDPGSSGDTIGGSGGVGNVISGSGSDGILINGSNNTLVLTNLIGTGANPTVPIPNAHFGIELAGGAATNTIGDGTATDGNTIAFNGIEGIGIVATSTAAGNSIRGNSIYDNNGIGIDLNEDGPTANTPNNELNTPIITTASFSSGMLSVSATLNAAMGPAYTIDFYALDATGVPMYLGSIPSPALDAGGNAIINDNFSIGTNGQTIIATATSPQGTSEFSPPAPIAYPPFVVTNTADSGAGSFRQALTDAQTFANPAVVLFDIPGGGPQTITLLTPLAPVTTDITIDGTSQPGYAGAPLIVLDGSQAGGTGLQLFTGVAAVVGLDIVNFPLDGIQIGAPGAEPGNPPMVQPPAVLISADYIGIDPTGTFAEPNGTGIEIDNGGNAYIGSTTPGAGNVISGNLGAGIVLNGAIGATIVQDKIGTNPSGLAAIANGADGIKDQSAGHDTVQGCIISGNAANGVEIAGSSPMQEFITQNYIGLSANGLTALANGGDGILVDGGANTESLLGNIVSGNSVNGIEVEQSSNVEILGNTIGAGAAGTDALGNANDGVLVGSGSTGTLIGGNTPAQANEIAANGADGILIVGSGSGTTIVSNFIGTDPTATTNLGNSAYGVEVTLGAASVNIGASGEGNTIAFNHKAGVGTDATSENNGIEIIYNSIFQNGALGIDRGEDGVTANVVNGAANYPVIVDANTIAGVTTVDGTLTAGLSMPYTIQFFASLANDPSGFGQGQTFLTQISGTTNSSGVIDFTGTVLPTVPAGQFISAIATMNAGSTSEFSNAVIVGPVATQNGGGAVTVTGSGGTTMGSVTVASGNLVVTISGQTQTFPISSVTGLTVNLGDGNANLMLGDGVPSASVMGGAGDDTITSTTGDDTLVAGDGNSSITGGSGACKLIGGLGNDTLVAGSGSTHINTGDGNSIAIGGSGAESVHAGAGADTLTPGTVPDKLVGGSGTTYFVNAGESSDTIIGGAGISFAAQNTSDNLTGISDFYDVTLNGPPSELYATTPDALRPVSAGRPGATPSVVAGVSGGVLNIYGTMGDDSISVKSDGLGNLKVHGDGLLLGLFSEASVTGIMINGGPGNDSIHVFPDVPTSATLRGGPGNDTIKGGGGNNVLVAGQGNDTLVGGAGNNLLIPSPRKFLAIGSGADLLVGGPPGSSNSADFTHRTDMVYLSNDGQPDSGDAALGEHVTIMPSVQNILSGTCDDTLVSTTAASFLAGGELGDSIKSGGPNSILVAGHAGNDTININSQPGNGVFLLNGHVDTYENSVPSDILQTDFGKDVIGV